MARCRREVTSAELQVFRFRLPHGQLRHLVSACHANQPLETTTEFCKPARPIGHASEVIAVSRTTDRRRSERRRFLRGIDDGPRTATGQVYHVQLGAFSNHRIWQQRDRDDGGVLHAL